MESKIKRIITILLAVYFLVSLAATAVSATIPETIVIFKAEKDGVRIASQDIQDTKKIDDPNMNEKEQKEYVRDIKKEYHATKPRYIPG